MVIFFEIHPLLRVIAQVNYDFNKNYLPVKVLLLEYLYWCPNISTLSFPPNPVVEFALRSLK